MPIIDVSYTSLEDVVTGTAGDTISGDVLTAVEVYYVTFDNGDAPALRKLMAWFGTGWSGGGKVLIPEIRSQHVFDQFLFVKSKDSEIHGGPNDYKVTVTYESIGDPLLKLPLISYGSVGVNEQVDSSVLDTEEGESALVNSSDELFDPPITVEIYDEVVTIVRNEEIYNASSMSPFKNSINKIAWQGFEPETVLLQSINAIRRELQLGYFYYEVTYVLYIRFDGWRKLIIDQGFRTVRESAPGVPELDAENAKQYIELVDSESKPMTSPTLLKNGQKLPDGEDAVKLSFLLNRRTDLNALGLPTI